METGAKQRQTGRETKEQRQAAEARGRAGRRQLTQLVVCLILFAFVFVGRGMDSASLSSMQNSLAEMIRTNTDFRTVFSSVGASMAAGEPTIETFGVLCSELFGERQGAASEASGEKTEGETTGEPITGGADTPQSPSTTQDVTTEEPAPFIQLPTGESAATQPEKSAETAQSTGAGGMPADTVTPVMGTITSPYGYRTHPIDGMWKLHNGVDLKATEGTAILAFADGTVDYVGESPAYGNYMQLKHANGVTSFYAHCSVLCVQKGQTVKAGEKVAEVGQTGNVTGPHLHFELKKDGKRIDPSPYIETQK